MPVFDAALAVTVAVRMDEVGAQQNLVVLAQREHVAVVDQGVVLSQHQTTLAQFRCEREVVRGHDQGLGQVLQEVPGPGAGWL